MQHLEDVEAIALGVAVDSSSARRAYAKKGVAPCLASSALMRSVMNASSGSGELVAMPRYASAANISEMTLVASVPMRDFMNGADTRPFCTNSAPCFSPASLERQRSSTMGCRVSSKNQTEIHCEKSASSENIVMKRCVAEKVVCSEKAISRTTSRSTSPRSRVGSNVFHGRSVCFHRTLSATSLTGR